MSDYSHNEVENMQRAKTATIMLDNLRPILQEVRNDAVAKMKNLYRSGETDQKMLLSCVASLVTLDDIENRLRARMNRGRKTTEGVMNDRLK